MSNLKSQISNVKFLITGYLIGAVSLFLYSFTQVDLGLTLSKWSIWQVVQKFFQNIGYFNRPLSAGIFFIILLLLFTFYLKILSLINREKIESKTIWKLIISITVILTFSYNAFSYDLFNYIFDAKIITHYGQNPYFHKALDFAGDPMLSFMHWTHRIYPYGPVWLGLTVPLSFIGMQVFLPTFFLFKALISLCFLGTAFYIGKILNKISPNNELFGVAFFALNPLVVIEVLVSSHNDIPMIFFAMWAIFLLMNKKYIRSIILLMLSAGIKFATILIVPFYAWITYLQKTKKQINYELIFISVNLIMIISVVLASLRTSFQPWYLLSVIPFAALVSKKYFVFIPVIVCSFVGMTEYLPFLYTGNWDNPIPMILNQMTIYAVLFSLFITSIWYFKKVIK